MCITLIEICTPGYCLNGGICKPIGNQPTCICQPGYTGARCENKPGKQALGCYSSHSLSDCTLQAESSFRLLDFKVLEKDCMNRNLVLRAYDPFGQH